MAQSLTEIYLHFIFSTKERLPFIDSKIEEELHQYICGVCRNLASPVIKINGIQDHIHLLVRFEKMQSVSTFISEVKSSSSRWIKAKGPQYQEFSWQKGYGCFSISSTNIGGVKKYIENQKTHHQNISFKEELLWILKRSQINYNEKYLFD